MALDLVNVSQPDDHQGDILRDAFIKTNDNLEYLLSLIGSGATQQDLAQAIEQLEIDLSGLQTQINGKANTVHTHTIEQIVGLVNALNSKVNTSTFNSAIGQINLLISQMQEVIAELQQGSSEAIVHNELSGLQGGTSDEYYHLTESQLERVLNLIYVNYTSSISLSPTTGERGLATNVTVNYQIDSNDDNIISAGISQVGMVTNQVNQGPQSAVLPNIAATMTVSMGITYVRNGTTGTTNTNVNYTTYIPQWSGISATPDLNTSGYTALNAALTKVVQADDTITRSLQPVNQYVWFVSTNANATITNSGFPTIIGDWNSTTAFFIKQTVTLTLANGMSTAPVTFYRTRETVNLGTPQQFVIT